MNVVQRIYMNGEEDERIYNAETKFSVADQLVCIGMAKSRKPWWLLIEWVKQAEIDKWQIKYEKRNIYFRLT